jgi:hypothetical protein
MVNNGIINNEIIKPNLVKGNSVMLEFLEFIVGWEGGGRFHVPYETRGSPCQENLCGRVTMLEDAVATHGHTTSYSRDCGIWCMKIIRYQRNQVNTTKLNIDWMDFLLLFRPSILRPYIKKTIKGKYIELLALGNLKYILINNPICI